MEPCMFLEIAMNRWINHLMFAAVIAVTSLVAIVAGLSTSRDPEISYLIECLKDPDDDVRAGARFQLMRREASAYSHVIELLDGDNKHARREAVFFINACPTHRSDAAVPALIRLLDEDDGDLQRGVIEALASLGPGARAAAPKLRLILKDKREFASADISPISSRPFRFVPHALVRIQGNDALWVLLEQLHDPDVSVEVVDALGLLGPAAAQVRPELERMKSNEDGILRRSICRALANMDGP